jgi:leucyl-tRNA synthetase
MEMINEIAQAVPSLWDFYGASKEATALTPAQVWALKQSADVATLLMSPYTPHIAEEMWKRGGHKASLAKHPWPSFDPQWIQEDTVLVVVQVNGKVRGRIQMARGKNDDDAVRLAQADENVRKHVEGKVIRKTIVVPDKLVNLVVQ